MFWFVQEQQENNKTKQQLDDVYPSFKISNFTLHAFIRVSTLGDTKLETARNFDNNQLPPQTWLLFSQGNFIMA